MFCDLSGYNHEESQNLKFSDRKLPSTTCSLNEHPTFDRAYFVDLHQRVNIYDTDDFCGCESQLSQAQLSFDKLGQLLIDIGLAESKSKACPPAQIMTYLGVSLESFFGSLNVFALAECLSVALLQSSENSLRKPH